MFKNIVTLVLGCFLAICVLEIGLRVYNPFGFRLRGSTIVLPHDVAYRIDNDKNDKLDKVIYHSKNSLGFRGEELTNENSFKVLTVGGSTTECFYVSDGKTWPDLLGASLKMRFKNIWFNNAGLDGMSTIGHIKLLEQVVNRIKPNIIIFLVGINDVSVSSVGNKYDNAVISQMQGVIERVSSYLEVVNVFLNLWRYYQADRMGLVTRPIYHGNALKDAYATALIPESELNKKREEIKAVISNNLMEYSVRIEKIIAVCRSMNCVPVFLTQPSLLGCVGNPRCGGNIGYALRYGVPNLLVAEELEAYNEALKRVSEENDVLSVDMANMLDMDERFYYDAVHYTNEGCEAFSLALSPAIVKLISKVRPDLVIR
ncbi:MAG: lysophospholipase L1-like esterase [Solidesulfovibrio magneticus str. Maddingley MBC34]|uniref:Lysophospholipase L1-like esterase n=1 Tax=Solidesulfovibrio magneticus str. Maddingley MBC34 TaxID=1206767 RepID=K6GVJ3_9BACT|nr:MAG: lysophospholipase L1-like esterase [Solidesulfovibrio magneticus str. Maddingley MBC34]